MSDSLKGKKIEVEKTSNGLFFLVERYIIGSIVDRGNFSNRSELGLNLRGIKGPTFGHRADLFNSAVKTFKRRGFDVSALTLPRGY